MRNSCRRLASFLIVLTFSVGFLPVAAQQPGIRWQYSLGGSSFDIASFSFKISENEFITVGTTTSVNGDMNDAAGDLDIWIARFNGSGTLLWKTRVGGAEREEAVGYIANPDGSFVLLGNTYSTDSSSAENHNFKDNHGSSDILLLKVSAGGTLLWKKCFGGAGPELGRSIVRTGAGYVVAGSTRSVNGDVAGNHGGQDLWLFQVNETGTLLWQNCLGGTGAEAAFNAHLLRAANRTLWLATETTSNNTGNVTANNGQYDIWLVQLDSMGNLLKQRTIGGLGNDYAAMPLESQGGRIYVSGYTYSANLPAYHANGTITNNNGLYRDVLLALVNNDATLTLAWQKCFGGMLDDLPRSLVLEGTSEVILAATVNGGGGDVLTPRGQSDLWITRISATGTIVWQRALGGTGSEVFTTDAYGGPVSSGGMQRAADGGLLVYGHTASPNTGDVTGYHASAADSAYFDTWILKLNTAGTPVWKKALGGSREELVVGPLVELSPVSMIVTGHSTSGDGDLSTNRNGFDLWLVNLGSSNELKGMAYFDQNANGIRDAGERSAEGVTVQATGSGTTVTAVTGSLGTFRMDVGTGTYTTRATYASPYYNLVPLQHTSTFATYYNTDSFGFALQPIGSQQDLRISLVPLTVARPGFEVAYRILYKNAGTTAITNGTVKLAHDSRLARLSANPTAGSATGDTLTWTYTNLQPADTASITVRFRVNAPPAVNNGDTLRLRAFIDPIAGDVTPRDDTALLKQLVQGSYDPNDKYESNGGRVTPALIASGDYFNYTIRFQNTGTDTAFTVFVRDTLDNRLDWSTLEMVTASHPYELAVTGGNQLSWKFTDINLPDSNVNEPASHGYIAYRIRPLSTVPVNDTVHNLASIYFDYNLPVVTNNAFTVVQHNTIILPLRLISFSGVFQDPIAKLSWVTMDEEDLHHFVIERSGDGRRFTALGTKQALDVGSVLQRYTFEDQLAGISEERIHYRLKMVDSDGTFRYSQVIMVARDGQHQEQLAIYPNPVQGGRASISYTAAAKAVVEIKVVDLAGKLLLQQLQPVERGQNTFLVGGLSGLNPGMYVLEIRNGEKWSNRKFTVLPQ